MVLEKVPTFQEVKDWAASKTTVDNHINDTNNPHNVSADAPVDDVNGQTGSVNLNYNDVGAKSDSYSAPVDSVNGSTGSVNIDTFNATLVASGSISVEWQRAWWAVGKESEFHDTNIQLVSGYDIENYEYIYVVDSGVHYSVYINTTPSGSTEVATVEYEIYET